jgi:hypothetical protein
MDYIIGVKTTKGWFCVDVTLDKEMTVENADYIGKKELKKVCPGMKAIEIKFKIKN